MDKHWAYESHWDPNSTFWKFKMAAAILFGFSAIYRSPIGRFQFWLFDRHRPVILHWVAKLCPNWHRLEFYQKCDFRPQWPSSGQHVAAYQIWRKDYWYWYSRMTSRPVLATAQDGRLNNLCVKFGRQLHVRQTRVIGAENRTSGKIQDGVKFGHNLATQCRMTGRWRSKNQN